MDRKTIPHTPPLPVVQYIRQAKRSGLTNAVIRSSLRKAGWHAKEVQLGFAYVVAKRKRAPIVKSRRQPVQKKSKILNRTITTMCVAVIIVSVLAIGAYHFVFNNWHIGKISYAGMVYTHFLSGLQSSTFTIAANYEDPFSIELRQGSAEFALDKPSGALTITSYGLRKSSSSGSFVFFTANGTTQKSVPGSYVYSNGHLYLTTGEESTDKKPEWLETSLRLDEAFMSRPLTELVTQVQYAETEVQDGVRLLRFSLTPKASFFKTLIRKINLSNGMANALNLSNAIVTSIANTTAENLSMGNISLWVRPWSRQVEQISFQTNAPSVAVVSGSSIPKPAEHGSNISAARLFTQILDIQNKLEEYKNKNGGYPESKAGIIQDMNVTWPEPVTGASCPQTYGTAYYTSDGSPNKKRLFPGYNISFCLEQRVGTLEAGIGIATPAGLITQVTCPNGELCFKPPVELEEKESLDLTNLLGATLTLTVTNSHEKNTSLEVPADAVPLTDIVSN